jgi:hypothetical protein
MRETPWDRARKTRSQLQEERLGNTEGGSKQLNSGRTSWRSKRDAVYREFLVEARSTESGSYTVKAEEWRNLRKEAFQTPPGCLPMIQVELQELTLAVVDFNYLHDLQMELLSYRERAEDDEELP